MRYLALAVDYDGTAASQGALADNARLASGCGFQDEG
jgi:hypothetical protein